MMRAHYTKAEQLVDAITRTPAFVAFVAAMKEDAKCLLIETPVEDEWDLHDLCDVNALGDDSPLYQWLFDVVACPGLDDVFCGVHNAAQEELDEWWRKGAK